MLLNTSMYSFRCRTLFVVLRLLKPHHDSDLKENVLGYLIVNKSRGKNQTNNECILLPSIVCVVIA